MGKDKRIHKFLSKTEGEYNKEIKHRMTVDVLEIWNGIGIPDDKYADCWKAGFNYAFERIKTIFELKEK